MPYDCSLPIEYFYFRRAERINDNHTRWSLACCARGSRLLLTSTTSSEHIIHIPVFEHIVCFHFVFLFFFFIWFYLFGVWLDARRGKIPFFDFQLLFVVVCDNATMIHIIWLRCRKPKRKTTHLPQTQNYSNIEIFYFLDKSNGSSCIWWLGIDIKRSDTWKFD